MDFYYLTRLLLLVRENNLPYLSLSKLNTRKPKLTEYLNVVWIHFLVDFLDEIHGNVLRILAELLDHVITFQSLNYFLGFEILSDFEFQILDARLRYYNQGTPCRVKFLKQLLDSHRVGLNLQLIPLKIQFVMILEWQSKFVLVVFII